MTGSEAELIQRSVDGELTPEERTRLAAVLAEDGQAASLERRLQSVRQTLLDTDVADPPPGFTATVMRRVVEADAGLTGWQRWRRRVRAASFSGHLHRRKGHGQGRPELARGGHMATKQILWAAGSVAAAVLGVGLYLGMPDVDEGTEATIGAAQRYQGAPLSEKDIVLADPEVQQFLQSDTFDRLMRDESTREVLSDAAMRTALADADLRALLGNPALAAALADPALRAALTDVGFWQALKAAEEKKREARFSTTDQASTGYVFKPIDKMTPKLSTALADTAFWQELKAAQEKKKEAQMTGGTTSADVGANLRMLTSAREAAEKLHNLATGIKKLQEAAGDPGLRDAIDSPAFRQAFSNVELQRALAAPEFAGALQNQAFQSALQQQAFGVALQSRQFVSAVELATSVKGSKSNTSELTPSTELGATNLNSSKKND
jgi:hypothetical protein